METSQKFSYWHHPKGRVLTILLAIVFLGMLAFDQVSKHQVQTTLLKFEDPTNLELFTGSYVDVGAIGTPGISQADPSQFMRLRFTYSRNRGAAFSMLASLDDQYRVPFFYLVTVLAVFMVGFYLRTTPPHHSFTRLGLIFIFAGAIGNFIDRVRLGYVIDFIDVDWNILGWRHNFAIFNIADVAINIGVIMLILDMILHRESKTATKTVPVNG